jgi:uncharacterized protein involved in propanediol utilization
MTPSFAAKHGPTMKSKQLALQKEFKLRHMNEISMSRYQDANTVGSAATNSAHQNQTQVIFKLKGL